MFVGPSRREGIRAKAGFLAFGALESSTSSPVLSTEGGDAHSLDPSVTPHILYLSKSFWPQTSYFLHPLTTISDPDCQPFSIHTPSHNLSRFGDSHSLKRSINHFLFALYNANRESLSVPSSCGADNPHTIWHFQVSFIGSTFEAPQKSRPGLPALPLSSAAIWQYEPQSFTTSTLPSCPSFIHFLHSIQYRSPSSIKTPIRLHHGWQRSDQRNHQHF